MKQLTHKEMSHRGGKATLKKHGKEHFQKMVEIREAKRKEQAVDNPTGQSTA